MRRRAFLGLGGACTLAATAGCLASDSLFDSTDDGHPFAGETVPVRVDDESTTDHDVAQNAREVLQFWETESQRYAGFTVAFEHTDAEDAPFVITYRDDPTGCESVDGYSSRHSAVHR
jgi:hypothetical protein